MLERIFYLHVWLRRRRCLLLVRWPRRDHLQFGPRCDGGNGRSYFALSILFYRSHVVFAASNTFTYYLQISIKQFRSSVFYIWVYMYMLCALYAYIFVHSMEYAAGVWCTQKHTIHVFYLYTFIERINSWQWYARTRRAKDMPARAENMAKVGKYRRCGRTKGFGSSPQRASTIFYKSGSHQHSRITVVAGVSSSFANLRIYGYCGRYACAPMIVCVCVCALRAALGEDDDRGNWKTMPAKQWCHCALCRRRPNNRSSEATRIFHSDGKITEHRTAVTFIALSLRRCMPSVP